MSQFYVAILEANSEGEVFATIPDLPGVNAAAATEQEALILAIEFANDYVRDLVEDGHPVPTSHELTAVERDPEAQELGRALIPVEVPGKSVKISISIDEALLKRADRSAEREGLTRSAFIAEALGARLRMMRPKTMEEVLPIDEPGGSALDLLKHGMAVIRGGPMLMVPVGDEGNILKTMTDALDQSSKRLKEQVDRIRMIERSPKSSKRARPTTHG